MGPRVVSELIHGIGNNPTSFINLRLCRFNAECEPRVLAANAGCRPISSNVVDGTR
jgi:hypothetical protein